MTRFLIEVSQSDGQKTARQIDEAIRIMGSHFVTHADWRTMEGRFTGSLIAELNDEYAAYAMIPPCMRPFANIYELDPVSVVQ